MVHTVTVTKEDIDKGCVGDSEDCPLARALTRAFKTKAEAACGMTWLVKFPEQHFYLPLKAKRFMDRFDNRHPVSPFTFKIKVPDEK